MRSIQYSTQLHLLILINLQMTHQHSPRCHTEASSRCGKRRRLWLHRSEEMATSRTKNRSLKASLNGVGCSFGYLKLDADGLITPSTPITDVSFGSAMPTNYMRSSSFRGMKIEATLAARASYNYYYYWNGSACYLL